MTGAGTFRLHTVRMVPPEGEPIVISQLARSEDDMLERAAEVRGYLSFRDWQADHPDWVVAVDVSEDGA